MRQTTFNRADEAATVKEYERQALLDRLNRDGATIGASIPERLSVQGEPCELRKTILALQEEAARSPAQQARVDQLTVSLRRERTARMRSIETDDLDRAAAEDLATSIIGIDRALDALQALGAETNIEAEIERQRQAEHERWRAFIHRARGTRRRRFAR